MNYNRKFAETDVMQRVEHSSHSAISHRKNSAVHAKTCDLHRAKTYRKSAARIAPIAIALACIFFAFTQPEVCKAALLAGYETCVTQLLFALFPFLIAANLLIRCGAASTLARPLKPLCRALGFAEPCAAGLLGIALLGGFAPAVSGLSACVTNGQLSKAQASRLLPLLCFLGPSYIIIGVGAGMLGNLRTGVYLFIAQVCASVFTMALLRIGANKITPNPHEQHNTQTAPNRQAPPAPQPFTTASVIGDSFFAFLRLCGVILFFQFLAAGVGAVLPSQYKWLCETALEVTAACGSIAALGNHATYRCCAALSLLSASILMQISALCPHGVSCKTLILSRFLHLPFALVCFRLLLRIPQPHAVYSSLNQRVIAMPRLPLDQAALLFISLLFLADRLRKPLQRR